jgi:hemerythrin
MSLIEWKDEFNLGIEEVDSEHKVLVALINALHDAMLAGTGRADVVEGISEIYTLVSAHFEREEAFMRAQGRPRGVAGRPARDHRPGSLRSRLC